MVTTRYGHEPRAKIRTKKSWIWSMFAHWQRKRG